MQDDYRAICKTSITGSAVFMRVKNPHFYFDLPDSYFPRVLHPYRSN